MCIGGTGEAKLFHGREAVDEGRLVLSHFSRT